MKKLLSLALAALMSVSALTACAAQSGAVSASSAAAPASSSAPAPAKPKQLTVQVGADPDTLDPALTVALDAANQLIHSFEPLLTNAADGSLAPGQAERWEASDGGRTWTFHLRNGLKWSDGSALTAEDFVYSWRRLADPATAAPYAYPVVGLLENFEAVAAGKKTADALGISAPDAKTVVVRLAQPCAWFDKAAALPSGAPVQRAAVEAAGEAWAASAQTYVSNGPFRMQEWVPGSHVTYVKNPEYWDAASVKLDSIRFLLTAQPAAALSAYETGEAQMVRELPDEELGSLRTREDFCTAPVQGTYFLVIQTQKAPFNDPLVRRALSLAVDRAYLADTLMQGTYSPAGALVGPGITDADGKTPFMAGDEGGGFIDTKDAQGNLAKARECLAKAGYPDGKGMPAVEYLTNSAGHNDAVAEVLQQAWGQLGLTVNVRAEEWQGVLASRQSGNFAIARSGWTFDYDDPASLLELFDSANPNNEGRYKNAQVDAALAAAQSAQDPAERYAALHRAEALIMDDAACIPLAFYNDYWLQSKSVTGSWHTPGGLWNFTRADLAA